MNDILRLQNEKTYCPMNNLSRNDNESLLESCQLVRARSFDPHFVSFLRLIAIDELTFITYSRRPIYRKIFLTS